MTETGISEELIQTIEEIDRIDTELAYLFGADTVQLARQLDVADLNLDEKIVSSIAEGVSELKKLRDNPDAQLKLIDGLEQGTRILLCMWIMDMAILDKIRARPYTDITR